MAICMSNGVIKILLLWTILFSLTGQLPCQSTILWTKTPLTGSFTGWQSTEWSHWGTYPPTGEPPAVMTSTASTTTKITSVESLRRLTSLPSLVLVFALRPSLSTFVVILEFTRLPSSGRLLLLTLLISTVLKKVASLIPPSAQLAARITLVFTTIQTPSLLVQWMVTLPLSGGSVPISNTLVDFFARKHQAFALSLACAHCVVRDVKLFNWTVPPL